MSTVITQQRNRTTGAQTLTVVTTHEYSLITDIERGSYLLRDEDGDGVMTSQSKDEILDFLYEQHE